MEQIPSMWRAEVWHPLSVHFPIVLLLIGTVFFLAGRIGHSQSRFQFLVPASRLLLWLGVITAWISIYTGDRAHSVVTRTLCDPTVLKQHEIYAYWTAWLFTVGVAGETLTAWLNLKKSVKNLLLFISAVLFLGGSGCLTYSGHLGSSLVYQQGAGVYQPTEGCREFE